MTKPAKPQTPVGRAEIARRDEVTALQVISAPAGAMQRLRLLLGNAARFLSVVALLWTINRGSNLAMSHFHLPIPGFVLGFGLLYSAVATNVIPYRWIEPSARFLVKHLAFFLVPIVTGLLDYLDVLRASGVQIAIVLIVSAIIGLWATGRTAQYFIVRGGGDA